MSHLRYHSLKHAADATGTVVVIDVLRAFTTAAAAFAAGVERMLLVETTDEAWALKTRFPDALLMGEVGGRPIDGFDFGNSPLSFLDARLDGRTIIQRTTHGTRGVVQARSADRIFAASFVVAAATATLLRECDEISFVITGATDHEDGDEDRACADLLVACLKGADPDRVLYAERVRHSSWGGRFLQGDPDFPAADLEQCCEIDRYAFAMEVSRIGDLLELRPVSGH